MNRIIVAVACGLVLANGRFCMAVRIVIDSNEVHTSPAIRVDGSTGVVHLAWSKGVDGDQLVYANSLTGFSETVVSDAYSGYSNPVMSLDANGNVHLAFSAYDESWNTYYSNSEDWQVRDLGVRSSNDELGLRIISDGTLVIATQGVYGDSGSDVVLATSTDYEDFSFNPLHKPGEQTSPKIAADSQGNIHLAYVDAASGLRTVKYANSTDGFTIETTISTATESWQPEMEVDSQDNLWLAYTQTNDYTQSSGPLSEYGDVWLADSDSAWTTRKISKGDWWLWICQDLVIGEDGNLHVFSTFNHEQYIRTFSQQSFANFDGLQIQWDSDDGSAHFAAADEHNGTYFAVNNHGLHYNGPEPTTELPYIIPVPPGFDVGGEVNGGSSTTGGTDVTFDEATTGGDFSVEYNTPTSDDFFDSWSGEEGFAEGNFLIYSVWGNQQVWDVEFTGTFTDSVTLSFGYDDSELDPFYQEHESLLGIWHYGEYGPGGRRSWRFLQDSIDTENNIITITVDNFSPMALGWQVPEPSTVVALLGLIVMGVLGYVWRRRRRR